MIGSLDPVQMFATALFQWHVALCCFMVGGVQFQSSCVGCRLEGWLQRTVAPNRLQNRHSVAATVAGRGACHSATPWKGTWKLPIICHDIFSVMVTPQCRSNQCAEPGIIIGTPRLEGSNRQ